MELFLRRLETMATVDDDDGDKDDEDDDDDARRELRVSEAGNKALQTSVASTRAAPTPA